LPVLRSAGDLEIRAQARGPAADFGSTRPCRVSAKLGSLTLPGHTEAAPLERSLETRRQSLAPPACAGATPSPLPHDWDPPRARLAFAISRCWPWLLLLGSLALRAPAGRDRICASVSGAGSSFPADLSSESGRLLPFIANSSRELAASGTSTEPIGLELEPPGGLVRA